MPVFRLPGTGQLLDRARGGDPRAVDELLHATGTPRHMIAVRIDDRMLPRVDPSDLVQETLMVASERLPDYLASRSRALLDSLAEEIAFRPAAGPPSPPPSLPKRSVAREEPLGISDNSAIQLAGICDSAVRDP